jgi:hypothetical protein
MAALPGYTSNADGSRLPLGPDVEVSDLRLLRPVVSCLSVSIIIACWPGAFA